MNADRARELDDAAGRRAAQLWAPAAPWLSALYVIAGCVVLPLILGYPPLMIVACGVAGTIITLICVGTYRRR
jgi:hypothetical protein